jgi:hypothetical protein
MLQISGVKQVPVPHSHLPGTGDLVGLAIVVMVVVKVMGSWEVTEVGTFMPPEVEKSVVEGPGVVVWARPVELKATVKRPEKPREYLILKDGYQKKGE